MPKLFNEQYNNTYISQNVGLPINELDELGETLENRYNANLAAADQIEIGLANLDIRNINKPIIQRQLQDVKKSFADTVEKGDWENASLLVRQQAKNIATSAELKGALEDKAQYDAWSKELSEGLQSGKYNKEQYDYYLTRALEQNNKSIEVDPDTGSISNIFNFGKPTKDMSEEIRNYMTELSKLWKSNTSDNPIAVNYTDKNGQNVQGAIMYRDGKTGAPPGYYDVQQKKYIEEGEVRSAMRTAVMNDPKYRSFIEESSRIKVWQAEKQNGGIFTLNDLVGVNNPNAIFTEEEFKELENNLIAQGKNIDEILEDSDMVKALYLLGSRNELVEGMIEAPVQATAFEELTHKFMTDIRFSEALKLRNDLAKIAANGREARKTQRAGKEYDQQLASQLVIKNRGPVIDKSSIDLKQLATGLEERKQSLGAIQEEITKHRQGNGSANDISRLLSEERRLKSEIAIQSGQLDSQTEYYYNTPKGIEFLKDKYEEYVKLKDKTESDLTFEEFKEELKKPNKGARGFWGRLLTGVSKIAGGIGPGAPSNPEQDLKDFLETSNSELLKEVTSLAKTEEFPGLTGHTFDSEDLGNKSAIFRVANETKTRAYKQNRTGYYIPNGNGGNLSATEWENAIRKQYGDQNVDVKIVTSDADHSTEGVALFPDKIAVVDKTTGETLREDWIYPIDGGADEMLQIGLRGRIEYAKGTQAYEDATLMAALGTYTNLIQSDLNKAAAGVTPGSGRQWEGEPVDLPGPNGIIRVVPRKVDQVNYDPKTGAKLGYNTRWEFESFDENGNSKGLIPNPVFFNSELTEEELRDKRLFQFENINDAKVSIFKLNNGE